MWPKYSCIRICNIDSQIIDWIVCLSVGIKWILQQDGKSNNIAQDDEQHDSTLKRRNQDDIHSSMWKKEWNREKKMK